MKKINLSLLSKGRYFRGVVTLGTLRYVDIEAPYVGEGGGKANKWVSAKKEANRAGTEEGIGKAEALPFSSIWHAFIERSITEYRRFLHFLSLNKGTHSTYSVYRA